LKTLLEAIGICLGAKEEFNSDVIKDCLNILLNDPVPPTPIMRTVILSSQSQPDVRKFGLGIVIPSLIKKKVWITMPKVWEGIPHAAKVLVGNRDSEATVRALLGLPYTQLKEVLEIAPAVKIQMVRLLRALSVSERDEVVSGRWVGLESENIGLKQSEREKLIRDISNPSIAE
jgi:hypothetical protein